MSTHKATCKFCRRELSLEIDDDCPEFHIAKWIPIAACDRCADFHIRLLKSGDRCVSVLNKVLDARGTKIANQVRSEADTRLEQITREIMRAICDHYRVQPVWQRDMVDEMLARPDKVRFIISHMRQTVQKHREKAMV